MLSVKGALLTGVTVGTGVGVGAGFGITQALKKENSQNTGTYYQQKYTNSGVEIIQKSGWQDDEGLFNKLKECAEKYKDAGSNPSCDTSSSRR